MKVLRIKVIQFVFSNLFDNKVILYRVSSSIVFNLINISQILNIIFFKVASYYKM